MGVFTDDRFEELDWLSQATEPIESKLNVTLSAIPEEVVVTYDIIAKCITTSYYNGRINKDNILFQVATMYGEDFHLLPYSERSMLIECFTLKTEGPTPIVDFTTKTLIGTIRLVKIKNLLDDKALESILGHEGINKAAWMTMDQQESVARATEVMDILGKCEEAGRSKSGTRKRRAIRARLIEIFKNNEWKIKDFELANKVGFWVADYVTDGNLASFSNLCRLKVMTHKGMPIYSMKEIA